MRIKAPIYLLIMVFLFVACSTSNQTINTQISTSLTVTSLLNSTVTKTTKPATPPPTLTLTNESPSLSPTFLPSLTPNPTSDYSGLVDAWSIYSNGVYGFSFEYPKLYDAESYLQCRVRKINSRPYILYINFGYRSELGILVNDMPSFSQFVDRWINGMDITSQTEQYINELEAVTIEYRFGGLNRYGTSTFLIRNNDIFVFNFTAGGFCDLSEIGLDEFTAYKHAVTTFKLFTPYP